jgi:signal transduction histidine kinase
LGLTVEESQAVYNEIRLIQSLIKDHFGFVHKNLSNSYEYVSLEFARKGVESLVRSYLPKHLVKCNFVYMGTPADCVIHYPSFSRILTNLIKNIADHSATEVEIVFAAEKNALNFFIKNKVLKLKNERLRLAEDLGSIILSERSTATAGNGLGLESVAFLTEKLGGTFQFLLEGDYWVTKVVLPCAPAVSKSPLKKAA